MDKAMHHLVLPKALLLQHRAQLSPASSEPSEKRPRVTPSETQETPPGSDVVSSPEAAPAKLPKTTWQLSGMTQRQAGKYIPKPKSI